MGFFSNLFKSSSGGKTTRSRIDNGGNSSSSRRSGDIITKTGGGKHTHQEYTYKNSPSGSSYKEYHGGENSGDRSYNK
ncbi:MAG: hypothetical protein OEX08_02470 [Candidatus Nomurabacteria bacterium]|nr:hypothetical protein [Candidatus Nomurabacteria bacterium]